MSKCWYVQCNVHDTKTKLRNGLPMGKFWFLNTARFCRWVSIITMKCKSDGRSHWGEVSQSRLKYNSVRGTGISGTRLPPQVITYANLVLHPLVVLLQVTYFPFVLDNLQKVHFQHATNCNFILISDSLIITMLSDIKFSIFDPLYMQLALFTNRILAIILYRRPQIIPNVWLDLLLRILSDSTG